MPRCRVHTILLALPHGVAVGAVAQPVGERSVRVDFTLGLKAERDERGVHVLLGRARAILRRQVAADLPPGRLHRAQAGRARRDDAGEPATQVGVGAGRLAAGSGVRCNRPHVPRPPPRLASALACHQACFTQALEVYTHAVGMQRQALGQLLGARRTPELAQHAEQPRAGRLGKLLVGPRGEIHRVEKFYTPCLGKLSRCVIICPH